MENIIKTVFLEGEDLENYQIARAKIIAALVYVKTLEYTGNYNAITQHEVDMKLRTALNLIDEKIINLKNK